MYRRRGEGLDKGRFRFHARAHIRERMLAVFGCQAPNLVQIIGVEGGGLALCPVGCRALVVSCPRRVGSVYFQWVLGSSPRSVLIKINDKKQR